jgi:hypothetical protein
MDAKNMKGHALVQYLILLICATAGFQYLQTATARTESFVDSANNLEISMEAPESWNSGTIAETIAILDWRFKDLNAVNNDASGIFVVGNLFPLPLNLGEKSGVLSLLLSQYVTINKETDVTFNDGSSGHEYSITISPDQLSRLGVPLNKTIDATLISTEQKGAKYFILYASDVESKSDYEDVFQDILHSVKFGSVFLHSNSE